MSDIKAVLLDIDNTVLDFHECAKAAMLSAAEEKGIVFPENYFETFLNINNALWHRIEQGELTREELFLIRWPTIFKALGVDADGIEFEKLFRQNLLYAAEPVDGAKEMLEYLSGRYPVYAATNSMYDQQVTRLEKAGFLKYFSGMFVSEKIGAQKPSQAFYEHCIKSLELKPDEIMMIGDSLTADIGGAKQAGIKTCWFNFEGEPREKGGFADCIIDTLDEIKKIL